MKKTIIVSFLAAVLAATSWAGDFGVGVSATNEGAKFDNSTNAYTYGYNNYKVTLVGVIPLGETWELNPYGTYGQYVENDKDNVTSSYVDKYTRNTTGFGAKVFHVTKLADQFRFLAGLNGELQFMGYENTGSTSTQKVSIWSLSVPVAAEVRIVPNFGVRLEGTAAGFSNFEYTSELGSTKSKQTMTNFSFASSTFSLGVFLYF